ncbi:putative LRR receptor-like serine/threonine-protein [Sesbania bispinosa]|nr:putative LRR receptor-like serine/threonine-protein [Sesbania bispinosa]
MTSEKQQRRLPTPQTRPGRSSRCVSGGRAAAAPSPVFSAAPRAGSQAQQLRSSPQLHLRRAHIWLRRSFARSSETHSTEQNPNLCESTSCNQQMDDQKKKKNIVIPVVASVAGIVVLQAIVAATKICGCGLKKRKPRGKPAANYHLK